MCMQIDGEAYCLGTHSVQTYPWRFSKAGIVTTDLAPLEDGSRALIGRLDRERSGPLMAAMDECNRRLQ